jgi:hypothetical protein
LNAKKKPLTRKAKSGDIYHFLSDVAYSLYESQIQNNRYELILKRYDSIDFLSGFKLNLDDREVIKVSVTSLEFLSLHDKILSQRMMMSLYDRALVAHSDATEDQKNRLNKFNTIANSFSKVINNAELRYQIEHINGFSNTLFINMFHLFYVLRFSNDTNTFVSSLLSTKNIVTSAKDFYTEHSNLVKG